MRNYVFDQRCTDSNWNACREYWENDRAWLLIQYRKLPRPLPKHENLPLPKQ